MREAASVRLARVLAVLAVIAGILAMHGLATGHQGASATPLVPALVAAVDQAAGHAAPAHTHSEATQHGECHLLCQGGEHALALLCVAVLLAAAGGALVLRQRTGLLPLRTGPPARLLPRTAAPPRSFDPVAELCISRT
jgi:hypothetical protein